MYYMQGISFLKCQLNKSVLIFRKMAGFAVPTPPIELEKKEPTIKMVPYGIFIPNCFLFVVKWSSTIFVYSKGSDELECENPSNWKEIKDKDINTYCKV